MTLTQSDLLILTADLYFYLMFAIPKCYNIYRIYSDTSANEDNSFRNHIHQPKLLAVSNVNNPVGLVCLPYMMWSAHFFVTHIQTEKISSWNGPTVHICCFMLAHTSTKTFVSRIHIRQPVRITAKKSSLAEKFVSRVTRQPRYHCTNVSVYNTTIHVHKSSILSGLAIYYFYVYEY